MINFGELESDYLAFLQKDRSMYSFDETSLGVINLGNVPETNSPDWQNQHSIGLSQGQ